MHAKGGPGQLLFPDGALLQPHRAEVMLLCYMVSVVNIREPAASIHHGEWRLSDSTAGIGEPCTRAHDVNARRLSAQR